MPLMTQSRFKEPDQAFVTLIEARRGLSEREASELDAKLVLILANHIGDIEVLRAAIAFAKQTMPAA
jgi:predicted LPLAT superfamily acyltransferase